MIIKSEYYQINFAFCEKDMITTIAVVLLVLWLLGFVGFQVLGSFIHILLVLAIVFFLIRIIKGENPFK